MQHVADWLEKLGLGQYAQRFAENDINFGILPHLTDQDLKELGVASLGHRRQLLLAIAELNDVQKGATQPRSETKAPIAPRDTAERRQITVMFSDLVGSTALSSRMDPEDLREVISAYQKCVAETVQRFGGFVAKYMGDGVLVYFGYPKAHEDDAERSVRAGLELIHAVGNLKSSAPLQTRVGIATGLVVVGDLIGSGAAQEQAVVGETPNLAARLQGVAEPNTVVIGASTRKLIGNLFELQDLGAKEVKGIAQPIHAWAALRASAVESRFEALHASGLTELVGRQEELEILLRRWSKAKTGEGQVVLLSGEAGIGKSRLTAALMERLAGELHTRLRYFCSPQHADSALYPIIGQMERAAEFAHGDTAEVRLDKLDVLLAQTSTSTQDVSLFADMLSLPNDGRYPALDTTPEQRRLKTLEALGSQMEALSRSKPVLMIFEDAHWSDPTSLEVIGRIVGQIATLRVLLLVTFRPEFAPPWIGQPHVTALTLNRLPKRDIDAMIDHVVGNKPLPASIRQDIIERTDGIPLFVEEMTKAVLEAESEGEARQAAAAIPGPASAVPASLHASLMARLDRLGPAKEMAQIGAAIGRAFSHSLLASVARKPETELAASLDRLIQSGLLLRQGLPPNATYLFKHALIQDAAYGTLLREPRRGLHARIAETIESQFTDIVENQPELLARHFTEARLTEKAAGFWGKAGQRSLGRSALVEAVSQLATAIEQIAALPATPALRREGIKLQVALAKALMHTKGYGATETKVVIERARSLIEQAEALGEPPDDPLQLFSVLNAFWLAAYVAFDGDLVCETAAQFLALAKKQKAIFPLIVGHRLMGTSLTTTGDLVRGRAHYDEAMLLCDSAERPALTTRFGQAIRVSVLADRSVGMWMLGYPDTALADSETALREVRGSSHAATTLHTLAITSLMKFFRRDYAQASSQANELAALGDAKSALFYSAHARLLRASLLALTGESLDAVRTIKVELTSLRSTGAKNVVPLYLGILGVAYAELGQFGEAQHAIDEAILAMETKKERWWEAHLYRIAGEIALKSPERDRAGAQAHFERALSVARQQQAKSWELRAATSLARLWRDQGKQDAARDLLAPVYGWFTEGFDTLDLKEAKALLDELTS